MAFFQSRVFMKYSKPVTDCLAKLILVVMLCSCGTGEPAEENGGANTAVADTALSDIITLTEPQYKAIGIELGQIQSEEVSTDIKVNGKVDLPPENRATVSLPIGGKIRYVKALPGQAVRRGELLATVESFEFIQLQQDFLQQSSRLDFLEKELERQRILSNENVGARKNFEQAQADFAATRAEVQALEAKLRLLGLSGEALGKNGISSVVRVVSPVNGYITEAFINLGKVVTPGEELLEIIDKAHMHIELTVFEQDAPFVRQGQPVRIFPGNGSPLDAYVYLAGRMLEGESRTLNVHAHVRNEKEERRLIPGSYVTAYIQTGSRTAATVPPGALVRKGPNGFVYVRKGAQTFRRILVTIGSIAKSGNIEILSQVPLTGEALVIKGAYLIDAELSKRSEAEEP